MIAAQSGEREKALKLIEQIHLLSPQNKIIGTELLRFASVYFVLRMKESGYNSLRSFVKLPITKKMHHIFLKYIDIDKNFDSVRDEDEFKEIINKKR